MARFLFINPPLVLEDDFIDYPYFANHGLLACAGLAARSGADVTVHDASALPDSGRHRRPAGGCVLGVPHDRFVASLPRDRYDVVVVGAVYLLDGIGNASFDRFLARCFDDGVWQNTFGIGAGTRSFVTSIGCPHRCIFCTSNPGWRRTGRKLYRPIPLTRLRHWAYLLKTVFGTRKLIVLDEMVNVRTDFEAMLRMLNELDFTYDFPNGMRADHLSRQAVAAVRDAHPRHGAARAVRVARARPARGHRPEGRRALPAPSVLRSAGLSAGVRGEGARRVRHEDRGARGAQADHEHHLQVR